MIWTSYKKDYPSLGPENKLSQKETSIPTIHVQMLC